MTLPAPLAAMAALRQWIPVRFIPQASGKTKKLPIDHRTGEPFVSGSNWQQDPDAWTDYQPGYGFLFTPVDPFFFIDIDDCLQNGQWSPEALALIGRFPGAAVEVSHSGQGLHIFGTYTGPPPLHSCKNIPLNLELYTESRFCAITGDRAMGDVTTDCTAALVAAIAEYFPPSVVAPDQQWTTTPVPGYTHLTDDEVITKAGACVSTAGVFGGRVTFNDLWANNVDALARQWPGDETRSYDNSSADAALAQHLAFWTGKCCERMLALMQKSALVRDKWDRVDYLQRTILRAVALQGPVYSVPPLAPDVDITGLVGSPKQINTAAPIRAAILAAHPDLAGPLAAITDAGTWISNRGKTGPELLAMITPIAALSPRPTDGPEFTAGYQLLSADLQPNHFRGCIYVQDQHRVFTPSGVMLKPEQFNATYGGYLFEVGSGNGSKPAKKAWDAFTESQLVRYPIADSTCFAPQEAPGTVVVRDGRRLINTYIPTETRRLSGDAGPFLRHLSKVLHDPTDRTILLSYLAACVQLKGMKFQWAPLIQGVEGNGKSLFTRCVAHAIGEKYCHMPPADQINEKFNEWMFDKLFIGVEDIYIPTERRELIETLKPMITNERQPCRAMQASQVMRDCCANFIFNSNYKDAVRKTENDRRYCVFYCPQQKHEDLERDGMTGDYFPRLYDWLRADGYAIVTDYLFRYEISVEFKNQLMYRAPKTSTTAEAIIASMGPVEQRIADAIDEELPGFCGGWVSSSALDALLKVIGKDKSLALNKRREILQTMGYDWHPALRNGRVNNLVLPDNGKPKLFIKKGHIASQIPSASMVEREYEKAQKGCTLTGAGAVFERGQVTGG